MSASNNALYPFPGPGDVRRARARAAREIDAAMASAAEAASRARDILLSDWMDAGLSDLAAGLARDAADAATSRFADAITSATLAAGLAVAVRRRADGATRRTIPD